MSDLVYVEVTLFVGELKQLPVAAKQEISKVRK